jgi:hypothetical protein
LYEKIKLTIQIESLQWILLKIINMSNALDLVNHELPENITSEWVDVQVAYSRDCRVLSDQHLNLAIEKDTSAIRHATLATEGQAELERRWETNRKT